VDIWLPNRRGRPQPAFSTEFSFLFIRKRSHGKSKTGRDVRRALACEAFFGRGAAQPFDEEGFFVELEHVIRPKQDR
jgi:hypothetical protein